MKKLNKNLLILIYISTIFVVSTILYSCLNAEEATNTSYSEPLIVKNNAGKKFYFFVEVASDEKSRQKGLMFRYNMDHNNGMLFNFITEKHVTFWMHNTYIPLDLIFINSNGIVVNIFEDAVPMSKIPIPSIKKVKAVLEINAGLLNEFNIRSGSTVGHKIFSNFMHFK